MSNELLKSKIQEGFLTSAFRGVTGQLNPVEHDDKTLAPQNRFAEMICTKFEPFQIPKQGQPPVGFGAYSKSERINNRTLTNPKDCTSIQPPAVPEKLSTTGVVPNGLHNSRGFLETQTTQQRFKGAFDDEVMTVHHTGKIKDEQLRREREALKAAPFKTEEPLGFTKSSLEHSNLSKVERADFVYKSRHNLGGENSAKTRDATLETILKGNAVDIQSLKNSVASNHDSTLPAGYTRPVTTGWLPTAADHFCSYDTAKAQEMNGRFSTQPERTENQKLAPGEDRFAIEAEERRLKRNTENFETQTSSTMQNRQADSDVKKGFGKHSVLDVKNAVPTMNHRFHHPRSDVVTGTSYAPHQITQGQYKPTSSFVLPARD